MASAYPGGLDTFDTTITDVALNDAGQAHITIHSDIADALNKIEGELGTNPSQAEATVAALTAKMADKTIVTTKGDLLAASAASTLVRVGVGTDGQILTADAAATGGVAWTASPSGTFAWTAYTPASITGWAATPTVDFRYLRIGTKTVLLSYYVSGTSNTTGIAITLPALGTTKDDVRTRAAIAAWDNGVRVDDAEAAVLPLGNTLTAFRGAVEDSVSGWTASGTKRIAGQIFYELA
jgi:hypothetical protein